MADTKIPKSDPISRSIAEKTVNVEVYAKRETKSKTKDGSPAKNTGFIPKIVFELAGARDMADAEKAGYPLIIIYGKGTEFEVGDILEVTIKPKPKTKKASA